MILYLADENLPLATVVQLRGLGFSIRAIAESIPGAPDESVLSLCREQQCVLLTFDKDFGELTYSLCLPADCGIVLFRIVPQTPDEIFSIVRRTLEATVDWRGHFSVVDRKRVRMRPLRPG